MGTKIILVILEMSKDLSARLKMAANASIGVIRCNVKKNSSIKNQTFIIILLVLSLGQSTFQKNIIKAPQNYADERNAPLRQAQDKLHDDAMKY